MSFDLGTSEIVVNNDAKVKFFDAAGASVAFGSVTSTAGNDAQTMWVEGYGNFKRTELADVYAARGFNEVVQKLTLNAATPAQIAIDNTKVTEADTKVVVRFKLETSSYEAELSRDAMSFGVPLEVDLVFQPSDFVGTAATDATTFLTKLYAKLKELDDLYGNPLLIPSIDAGTASAVTTLGISGRDGRITFTAEVTGPEVDSSTLVVPTFAPATATSASEGRNTAKFIQENVRLLTDVSTRPYGVEGDELAVAGKLYTSFDFGVSTTNMHGSNLSLSTPGATASVSRKFNVFLNEDLMGIGSTAGQAITNFLAKSGSFTLANFDKADETAPGSIPDFLS